MAIEKDMIAAALPAYLCCPAQKGVFARNPGLPGVILPPL
jgi:hypothetical protein